MKSLLVCLMSLVFVQTSAAQQPTVSGQVRLSGGLPVAGAQVMLFDLTDLQRGPVAQATTDEDGQFALVALGGSGLPQRFALGQNYPNPFNPSTVIPYQLLSSGHVRLEVFNLLGQRLATLVDAERSAGMYTAQWDATDAAGRAVGTGVYIYRLSSGGVSVSRRMVLVDGQAGIPMAGTDPDRMKSVAPQPLAAAGQFYGLTVSGQGLVAYVDPAFRVGIDTASIVVEPYEGAPRMKLAAGGVWGDVNNDGQVDLSDVLLVMLYSADSSIMLPNNGDISLGDVNEDGRVNSADAVLLIRYLSDPFDHTLPLKIGGTKVSLGSSTTGSLEGSEVDKFVIESSSGTLVVYTTGNTDTKALIKDSSGRILNRDYDGGEDLNFRISTSVSAGTYYIYVGADGSGDYTLHVDVLDLAVTSLVNDSTLAFGQPFRLRATVRHQGFSEGDSTVLFYYRSTDATITADDTQIAVAIVELSASGIRGESISLIAPEDAGTYYYGACVESDSRESNTNNNCSDAVRVTVSSDFVYTPSTLSRIYWIDFDWIDEVPSPSNLFAGPMSVSSISRADLDGSNVEILVDRASLYGGLALDVVNGKMYWTNKGSCGAPILLIDFFNISTASKALVCEPGSIGRADLDGSNVEDLITRLYQPEGIALDVVNGKMYWTDSDAGTIQRADLDGSNVEDLITRLDQPVGIALDVVNGKMYWTDSDAGTIQRADLDGSNVEDLITRLYQPEGIALDVVNGKMYWTDSDAGTIQRADLDGSNVEYLSWEWPVGIALDVVNGKMYWTNSDAGTIQRADLDGSNVEDLITGLEWQWPVGIALAP